MSWVVIALSIMALAAMGAATLAAARLARLTRPVAGTVRTGEMSQRRDILLLDSIAVALNDHASTIVGHSQLLLPEWRAPLTPSEADSLQRIEAATKAIKDLSTGLACLAGWESGEMRPAGVRVDIPGLIESVKDEKARQLRSANCRTSVLFSSSACTIETDPGCLKYVISSMLEFLLRYTVPGQSIEIYGQAMKIRLEPHLPEARYAAISFSPAKLILREKDVQSLFSQAPGGRIDLVPLGSSMLIAQRIARAMGGDVRITSSSAPTFYALIPGSSSEVVAGS